MREDADHLQNKVRDCEPAGTSVSQPRSPDVHALTAMNGALTAMRTRSEDLVQGFTAVLSAEERSPESRGI